MSTTKSRSNSIFKQLVDKFEPRPIKTEAAYKKALDIINKLADKGNDLNQDEIDYISVLTNLVIEYERNLPTVQKFLAEANEIPPGQILNYLLEENGITQTELSKRLDMDQGNISAFIKGKRGISRSNASKLAKYFKVSLDLFIPIPAAVSV